MASILKVDTIQHTDGTTAVTAKVNESRQCVMGFMRTSGVSGDQNPVPGFVNMATQLSGDNAGEITRGGSVTHNSGIFSVPFTGLWSVEYFTTVNSSGADATIQCSVRTSQNAGTNFSTLVQAKESSSGSSDKCQMYLKAFWKVTDVANDVLKFAHTSFSSHAAEGSSTEALTYCLFTWLGDAD
jgi:hypothetical protein|tara:strand:- start:19 stop:570 length:552 start_codon:yes stop_codon:yes gene_type:complete